MAVRLSRHSTELLRGLAKQFVAVCYFPQWRG